MEERKEEDNVILNHKEKQPKIEGRFSHGETLYRRRGDSISMEETLFRYRVSGGDFISAKERFCFGGDFIL